MTRKFGAGYPSKRVWNKGKKKIKTSGMPLKDWQKTYQDERK